MGKIRLLSEALASQVAAGEVVERPASVVKELVENSIDAGASNIEIRVQRGGIALIRVTDDGCGMNRDDALMCLERNATSKIRTKEDLAAIHTLGFRGEALPSIASVSKFHLATREPDSLTGTEIVVNGGKVVSVKDCGEPPGTQIEVRSLFFNIPARRKFLRTENTEWSHLEQVVKTQAIEPHEHEGVVVRGFIGPPGMGRSDRRQQLSFLNGRPVEAAIISRALREGYHTALMKGQYPVTFLFLETDPTAVDVNVHPAKREVRFHDGFGVRDAIIAAVQGTLRERMTRPVSGVGLTGTSTSPAVAESPEIVQENLIPESEQRSLRNDWSEIARSPESRGEEGTAKLFTAAERERAKAEVADGESPSPPDESPEHAAEDKKPKAADYRLLGVLAKLYVLLESDEGLVLMDQHAAHERVLFEEMKRRMEEEGVPSQGLLTPIMVDLPPRDFDLVEKNIDTLNKLGLSAEPFGGNTLKIDSLPTFLKSDDPEAFLQEVIDEIRSASDRISELRLGEDMIATTVCRHAVKANDPLHDQELQKLLEDLLVCDMPYCCPHGRPTLIQIGYGELERKFGRRA
jgi:DNA mismatch repair protein MutL